MLKHIKWSNSLQEYTRGQVVADLKVIGETDRTGTTVHFTRPRNSSPRLLNLILKNSINGIQELAFLN